MARTRQGVCRRTVKCALACSLLLAFFAAATAFAAPNQLRVCADPNDLPFSNSHQQGFENKLADMVASDLGMTVSYEWFPQLNGFFRKTLKAGLCDVVMSVPSSFDEALPTRPYYRSTYVFVSRRDRHLDLHSFDDPALRALRIGVQVVGGEEGSLPPTQALSHRGLMRNVSAFNIVGNLSMSNPPAELIDAVASGDVDVAVVWGPLAGYFARQSSVPLDVVPVCASTRDAGIPFEFAISMGVRRNDTAMQQKLNDFLERRQKDVRGLLESYGVPLVSAAQAQRCQ
ncbi:MAG TPA: substrate-binding domain-containing protein [Terriglobales bacterium]|nr:substrate-binding domain-containing protein [Terriglobales bacterium]